MEKLLKIINLIKDSKEEPLLETIKPEMTLRNDLGFDSLDLAELTVRIEKEFQIDIFEEGIVQTIAEIQQKLGI